MSEIENILKWLEEKGVTIWVEGTTLKYKGKGTMPPDLLGILKAHKQGLIDALTNRDSQRRDPLSDPVVQELGNLFGGIKTVEVMKVTDWPQRKEELLAERREQIRKARCARMLSGPWMVDPDAKWQLSDEEWKSVPRGKIWQQMVKQSEEQAPHRLVQKTVRCRAVWCLSGKGKPAGAREKIVATRECGCTLWIADSNSWICASCYTPMREEENI